MRPAPRARSLRRRVATLALSGAVLAALAADRADAKSAEPTSLRVEGMTYVGSRDGTREVLLRSREASLLPAEDRAELHEVEAEVRGRGSDRAFTMRCDRVDLEIESQDFLAEGDVRGETDGGQRYRTEWVRYRHEAGLLYTDAPVELRDANGRFRGDGFRYHVEERRFELVGNVSVEQGP